MLDLTKPVQTRDGRPVRIYATDGYGVFSIHGAIDTGAGFELAQWSSDGRSLAYTPQYTLVNVPVKHMGWFNVYREGNSFVLGSHRPVHLKTHLPHVPSRIAVVKLEFTEGDGLSP
jgi:hypothetical protein